jgi:RsmE family RNA methyltransferase
VNIILFNPGEFPALASNRASLTLPSADPRAAHIIDVLRRKPGDTFDAGLVDGQRGKATLAAISPDDASLALTFLWSAPPPPLPPLTLIIGLPRPQTARKILNEATALGVSEMHFVATERGEPSYAQSTLWTTGEYRRHLIAGAAQAFCTRLPRITFSNTLTATIAALATGQPGAHRIALDNYESPAPLGGHLKHISHAPIILALGSERGWTATERDQLRAAHFAFAHLGPRVLRTETAATAAITLSLAHLGLV